MRVLISVLLLGLLTACGSEYNPKTGANTEDSAAANAAITTSALALTATPTPVPQENQEVIASNLAETTLVICAENEPGDSDFVPRQWIADYGCDVWCPINGQDSDNCISWAQPPQQYGLIGRDGAGNPTFGYLPPTPGHYVFQHGSQINQAIPYSWFQQDIFMPLTKLNINITNTHNN